MAEPENDTLIQTVECKFVKTDPALIERISIKRQLPLALVKGMMRYNVFTVNQFVQLSGLPLSTVTNKTRPAIENGKVVFDLEIAYPFLDSDGSGPKFILRNDKSERYLSL